MAILDILRDLTASRCDDITAWFSHEWRRTPPLPYHSVDLRHSGHKLAPVDTNLFPAGFHILSKAALERAAEALRVYLARHHPGARRILLIPENHTRNQQYLENVAALLALLERAGAEARLGSAAAQEPLHLKPLHAPDLVAQPLRKQGDLLQTVDGFTPDLVLLNNDLTGGVPTLLEGLSQPILPPIAYGWHRRRKSCHFSAYAEVAQAFCREFELDAWLLSALFHRCGQVDFGERLGLECVALGVEKLLHAVQRKYDAYGIRQAPYAFIKADSGTYGMGIMTARSGEEIMAINKKTRNKMNIIKEGAQSTEVIIQEGVPTVDAIDGKPAEPMIYLVGGMPVGGAYRVNGQRDPYGNLNAAGMEFFGMCDEEEKLYTTRISVPKCSFDGFGLAARLAALAASREETGEECAKSSGGDSARSALG